jgi:hypothetical protein
MPEASETHNLPPEGQPGGDTKERRPHVLLRDCEAEDSTYTVAYGSTQGAEAGRRPSPAFVLVDRDDRGYEGTGLTEKTWIYLCRLITGDPADLAAPRGRLADEWDDIKAALRRSLGIGTGTTASGEARGSWRGRVVRLFGATRVQLDGAEFALVVTEPRYSHARHYQQLIPIYHGPEAFGEEHDLLVEAEWVSGLSPGSQRAYLAIPSVFSGCETGRPRTPGHFVQLTSVVVDEGTMAAVDAALVAWFGLSAENEPVA